MLEALRRGANSWVLKPLFLLLVLAFVAWGVADVFTGSRTSSLATVGSIEITPEEYQATYGAVMNNFARRYGRRPTADEARLRGIDRAVLEDLINAAVLDSQVKGLGMALPQSAITAAIESDASFLGPDGKFDRATFDNFLHEIGYNERGYLNLRRREELRQQLTESMFKEMPAPAAIATFMHNWREETRTIQHFAIDPAKQVKLGEPDEAQLKEVYSAQQSQFVTPEYRSAGVVVLSPDDVKKSIEYKEDELRQIYSDDKAAREVPERRQVQQIPFKDKPAAEAAAKALTSGKSFMDVAKEAGATEKDVDLGLVTRGEMIDQAVATAAFALAKDKVSPPVAGRFATFLLRVTEIQPARTRTFEEMSQEIRDRLGETRSNEAIRRLLDAIDEGRAGGKTLKEIATLTKLKYYEIAQIDRQGRKPDGTPGYDGPDSALVIRSAFDGRPGVELDPVELAQGGYAWVDIASITEERQRPFADVQDDVKKVWQRLETSRQIAELAGKLIERANKGETLTALAKEMGTTLQTSKPFKRIGTESGLPGAAVQRSFAMPLGARASVEAGDDGKRMMFRLVEIAKPAAPTPEQLTQITEQLRAEMQNDAGQAYVLELRDRYGVRVNEDVFKRTTGTAPEQR
jgi:peptidyl-prolyl cis-trans isomerase D